MTLKEKFENTLDLFDEVNEESVIAALSVANIYFMGQVEEGLPEEYFDEFEDDEDLYDEIFEEDEYEDVLREQILEFMPELIEFNEYFMSTFDPDEYLDAVLRNWCGDMPMILGVIEKLEDQAVHEMVLDDMNAKLNKYTKFEEKVLEKSLYGLQDKYDFIDVSMFGEYYIKAKDDIFFFNATSEICEEMEDEEKEDLSESLLILLSAISGTIVAVCHSDDGEQCDIYGFTIDNGKWEPTSAKELAKTVDIDSLKEDFERISFKEVSKKK